MRLPRLINRASWLFAPFPDLIAEPLTSGRLVAVQNFAERSRSSARPPRTMDARARPGDAAGGAQGRCSDPTALRCAGDVRRPVFLG